MRIERVRERGKLSQATKDKVLDEYARRVRELLERYYEVWMIHDMLFALFHDNKLVLERYGIEVEEMRDE